MKEIYKDIKGHEGRYQVSNYGNVKSYYKNGKILKMKPFSDSQGYKRVELKDKGHMVHRLVASAFLGDIPEGHEVNHLDCNTGNNNLDNLEICTPSENMKHAYKMGVVKIPDNSGGKNGMAKLTKKDVLQIREMYDNKVSAKEIHKLFPNIKLPTIYTIGCRRSWKSV